jgi:hypothetical protein
MTTITDDAVSMIEGLLAPELPDSLSPHYSRHA